MSRDGFGSPVSRQPAHLHTQAESGSYLWDCSRVPRWRPIIYLKPPYAIGSTIPSLSGHAIVYRWRSLPRVRRQRASKPQGSSERVLPWQVTIASLFRIHYWYEVGMLKVPYPLLIGTTYIYKVPMRYGKYWRSIAKYGNKARQLGHQHPYANGRKECAELSYTSRVCIIAER